MSAEMPDWLNDLQSGLEESPASEEAEGQDSLDALRLQVAPAEEEVTPAPSAKRTGLRSPRVLRGFTAQQRFILALLLFLDVAFIGFLFLVMLGRFAIF